MSFLNELDKQNKQNKESGKTLVERAADLQKTLTNRASAQAPPVPQPKTGVSSATSGRDRSADTGTA